MNQVTQKVLYIFFVLAGLGIRNGIAPYHETRDFDAVLAIAPDYVLFTSVDDPIAWAKQVLKSKDYYTDVYRVDGKTVGCINYCIKRGSHCLVNQEHLDYNQDLEERWQQQGFMYQREAIIRFVCVDKDYRGRSIASQLIENALHEMKKQAVTVAKLYVKKDNHVARRLYEKNGFQLYGPYKKDKIVYLQYIANQFLN